MEFITDYKLENYILNSVWDDFPGHVKDRSIVCSIDLAIALLLGAKGKQHEVGIRLAEEIFKEGNIPVLGSTKYMSFTAAAVAMSHASNSFDIDDGHNMIRGHPGTSFVGGLLAAALDRDIAYREYLTALVISYEVTVRWALAMQNFYDFMHSTGTYGAFGTAAGVGRIFKFDRILLNNALSIADFHAPLVPVMRAVEYPSMNKDGVPFGTMMGVIAALEARAGYQGKTHLLEMPKYRYLLDSLGSDYEIMNLYFKPYTCCRWAHQPILACLTLMSEHDFTAEQIEKVKVHTFDAAARLSKIEPKTTDEAQYNIAYPVAAALVHGDLGYLQIRDEALSNPQVLEMMKRLEFVVDPEVGKRFPRERLAWVEIRLVDGTTINSDHFAAPGEAADNVDLAWITEKFYRITSPVLSPQKQDKVLALLSESSSKSIRYIIEEINRN